MGRSWTLETLRRGAVILALLLATTAGPGAAPPSDPPPLALAPIDSVTLTVVSPTVLEVTRVVSGEKGDAGPAALTVTVDGGTAVVSRTGSRRRVSYAPLRNPRLRVAHVTYLRLAVPLREGARVRVDGAGRGSAVASSMRRSPAIHVNQEGYHPDWPKKAAVGFWLGTLGELDVPRDAGFRVLSVQDGREVAAGALRPNPDRGFPDGAYQRVLVADFSELRETGTFVLQVPGLGVSLPFRIDDGLGAILARTYALGLYHQRCGEANQRPFTRFEHGPCHTAPAALPGPGTPRVDATLEKWARNRGEGNLLPHLGASLFPFSRRGTMDVHGGHHDAGDYSKYTINSAQLVHALVLAADTFPGVAALDNLGIPESGDGIGDILQEARIETEFLARMQDDDGGFAFLVYPRDRPYEDNVLPDRGDPQVVYPKNTSATAAAIAALAQASSSPAFARAFPAEAARYRAAALKGWDFLERAWARHGVEGAYQRLTHYGAIFADRDEVAWAATELYLATGEDRFQRVLRTRFNPSAPGTRRWGWWRGFEGYGCAMRSYALAPVSGRKVALDPRHLEACRREVMLRADELAAWAQTCAYGTSFPEPSRRVFAAGWYFPGAAAFELAAACQLEARPAWLAAIVSNFDFECGGNPSNVCFLAGLGWRRPLEMVSQYAQNDRRALPPSGIPIGSLQSGFSWVGAYQRLPGELTWPPDARGGYPLYDRWGDAFNTSTEVVASTQAQGLAAAAWLMARTPSAGQAWRPVAGRIRGLPGTDAWLEVPGLDVGAARVVWEGDGLDPRFAQRLRVGDRPTWVEVEAAWPDGRRVFAAWEAGDSAPTVSRPRPVR